MTDDQALMALLERLSAFDKPVNFCFDELQTWPPAAFKSLTQSKLLIKSVQAQSLECHGCELGCFMSVVLTDDAERAFIVCEEPEQQRYMGRVSVSLPRLQQWQSSSRHVAALVARLLGLEVKPEYIKESAIYKLGMLRGNKGRRWAILTTQPLALLINQQSLPVSDLLYFDNGVLVIDRLRVDDLLNMLPNNNGKPYTSDTSKQTARKLATQAMYQNWCDKYQKLKHQYSNKSDAWYSMQIAKLAIAQNRSSETIRKNRLPTKQRPKSPLITC